MDIARGLCYVHEQNIVHGDLSPGNVMMRFEPRASSCFMAKICDFGLSRRALVVWGAEGAVWQWVGRPSSRPAQPTIGCQGRGWLLPGAAHAKGGGGWGVACPLAKACVLAAPPCGCIQLGKVSVRCDCAAN